MSMGLNWDEVLRISLCSNKRGIISGCWVKGGRYSHGILGYTCEDVFCEVSATKQDI